MHVIMCPALNANDDLKLPLSHPCKEEEEEEVPKVVLMVETRMTMIALHGHTILKYPINPPALRIWKSNKSADPAKK
eukprot:7025518-Ditylum_brightwellii.AAC.1